MIRLLTLLIVIISNLLLGFYSFDLIQRNPETIFLTEKGIKDYERFNKKVPHHHNLIVKINFDKSVEYSDYINFESELRHLFTSYGDDYSFILPHHIYRSKKQFQKEFLNLNRSKRTLNLLGKTSLSFMVIERKNRNNFKVIIEDIKNLSFKSIEMAGLPYTNHLLDNYSKSIQESLFPLMFLISFLLILILIKNLLVSFLLFLPCLFSSIISLSLIKLFFSEMNMITSIIPLLTFTITLALAFHLYFTIKETNSFKKAIQEKKTPIILMVITTMIGFGSLYFSQIQVIKDFGLLSFLLILITTCHLLFWFYLTQDFLKSTNSSKKNALPIAHLFHTSFSKKSILFIALISIPLGSFLLPKIKVLTDAVEYFPKSSGLSESIRSINKDVSGIPLIEIILETKKDDLSINDLQNIEKLETKISKVINDNSINLLSSNTLIKEVNLQYSGSSSLPDHILPIKVLRGKINPIIKGSYPLGQYYKISILGLPLNVDSYSILIKRIENALGSSGFEYGINGLFYNLMMAQSSMIKTLSKSFLIAVFIVSFIAWLYLKKIKIFFIFLFVNTIPVFISLIFMYLFGLSINIATIMTYSIAIGIIVDSSFHLVHALNTETTQTYQKFFRTIITPILGSSLLLILSFLLFTTNGFLPIRQFGLNLSFILFLGLVFDLFILPTLYLGNNKIKDFFDN